jgi:hypothetical protein
MMRKEGFRMIDPRTLRVLQAVAVHGSVAGDHRDAAPVSKPGARSLIRKALRTA